jgi:hypothetical protein
MSIFLIVLAAALIILLFYGIYGTKEYTPTLPKVTNRTMSEIRSNNKQERS